MYLGRTSQPLAPCSILAPQPLYLAENELLMVWPQFRCSRYEIIIWVTAPTFQRLKQSPWLRSHSQDIFLQNSGWPTPLFSLWKSLWKGLFIFIMAGHNSTHLSAHPHTASCLVLREGLKKNAQEKYYCRDNDTPLRVTAFQGKAK